MASSRCVPESRYALARKKWPSANLGLLTNGLLQRANLAFAIADLLVESRQVERRLEVVGMQLQFLDVLALRGPRVAALFGEQREVEVRQT